MERTVVITGLTRSPKILMIPLEYFLGCCFITMLPMMYLDLLAWLLTAPVWWMASWIITRINPHAHVLARVLWMRLRTDLFMGSKGRRYAP